MPVAANTAVTNAAAYLAGVGGDLWSSGNKVGAVGVWSVGIILGGIAYDVGKSAVLLALAGTICWWQLAIAGVSLL